MNSLNETQATQIERYRFSMISDKAWTFLLGLLFGAFAGFIGGVLAITYAKGGFVIG